MVQAQWLYGTGGLVVWYTWDGCMVKVVVQVDWLYGRGGMVLWYRQTDCRVQVEWLYGVVHKHEFTISLADNLGIEISQLDLDK
jgi:hypothetical protein